MKTLKPGMKATIYNQTPSGKLIVEGEATLVSKAGTFGSWYVKFDDNMEVLRHVDPNDVIE